MKVGDTAKGFWFESDKVIYNPNMDRYLGVEGEIVMIREDKFIIQFPGSSPGGTPVSRWYPLSEYLQIQREDKLNELGILCECKDCGAVLD